MDAFELFPGCQVEHIEVEGKRVNVSLSSKTKTSRCPYCHQISKRTHGHYTRRPHDLPLGERCVRLELRVKRFLCVNDTCKYRTFGERFDLIERKAQRSKRLYQAHLDIATQLGGEAGSTLAGKLNMPVSADCLLRGLRQQCPRPAGVVRVLGVDDWAMKKRERYGTILVDLEKRQVVDVLEGRETEVFAGWLATHPGVEVITRDRSHEYAKAAREAAPEAQQVADRWHLLQNLRQMLEKWLNTVQVKLVKLPFDQDMAERAEVLFKAKPSFTRMTKAAKVSSDASLKRRVELYHQVNELHVSGMGLLTISKKLGINRQTVRTYVQAPSPPMRRRHVRPTSILDPYLDYLEERLAEGCENASQLWRELNQKGYSGKPWQVHKWMQGKRTKPSKHGPKKPRKNVEDDKTWAETFLPSTKQLAWLLMKESSKFTPEETFILEFIRQDDALDAMHGRVQSFKKMLTQRNGEALDAWLEEAQASGITILQTFVHGLNLDYDAIKAALISPWSNGQVEGKVNKLKLIKRQMYGRANFDLLRTRVLLVA